MIASQICCASIRIVPILSDGREIIELRPGFFHDFERWIRFWNGDCWPIAFDRDGEDYVLRKRETILCNCGLRKRERE